MSYKAVLVSLAGLQGGYMLFDGIHELVTGTYFGGRVGPWGHIVRAVHLRVESMGPVFVFLGAFWLFAGLQTVRGSRRAPVLLACAAFVTLAYPIFGTILSLITLAVLVATRMRRGKTVDIA